jgi:DNA polymerase-3 subunit alpha
LFDALLGDGAGQPEKHPDPVLPDVPRWSESERLAREKEVLGFFISGHPLEKYRDEVRMFDRVNTSSLKQFKGQKIELPCVVTSVARQISKKNGAEWGKVMVEDFFGTASVLAFGDVWDQYADIMVQDAPVLVRGQVSDRERDEEDPPIFMDGASKLSAMRASGQVGVELSLSKQHDGSALAAAAEAFRRHPGASAVFVRWLSDVVDGNGNHAARLRSKQFTVELSDELISELRELFGAEQIRLVRV